MTAPGMGPLSRPPHAAGSYRPNERPSDPSTPMTRTRTAIIGGAATAVFVLLALIVGSRALDQNVDPGAAATPARALSPAATAEVHPSFLYGRVTTYDGTTYEGRLRWGGGEEAFWGHYFNGVKDENPWAALAPPELTEERPVITILGIEIGRQQGQVDLRRPFMTRFGDIARIEARGEGAREVLEQGIKYDPDVRVTLKSGTVFDLNRLDASDFDDGVRVWDSKRGVVDLGPRQIRLIEFLPTARPGAAPDRLYGTVRTRQGDFTGFLQWDREEAVGQEELVGHTDEGELRLRFGTIRAIERYSRDGVLVTLRDGREIVLFGTRRASHGSRGIYVDDGRYGRVLVSWDAFERVDFSPGDGGPTYDDYPPGHSLVGRVTTHAGRRLAGRLVFDLDESETTETLDAPLRGVDYTIPFGLVASVVLTDGGARATGRASVILQSGEHVPLERDGDLGDGNAGMLIFADGQTDPEYVPWADVGRIDFERPPMMYPPFGGR